GRRVFNNPTSPMNKNIYVTIVTREPHRKQSRKELDLKFERSPQPNSLADERLLPSGEQIAHYASETLHNSCADRKLGESSLSCSECRKFIEYHYRPIEKLKRQRKRKRLTDCLEMLGARGIQGDEAIFILSNLGGEV